jgi:conjugative element/phage-associated large polyvalent protein
MMANDPLDDDEDREAPTLRSFADRIRGAVDAAPEEAEPPAVRTRGAGRMALPVEDAVQPVLFGGEGAAGADRSALARARELQEAGTDPEAIWRETGWRQGPEGKWRFEIDDSRAALTPRALAIIDEASKGPLPEGRRAVRVRDLMEHPELDRFYPNAADSLVRVVMTDRSKRAPLGSFYNQSTSHIELDIAQMQQIAAEHNAGRRIGYIRHLLERRGQDPSSPITVQDILLSTLLHEFQHGIQYREGFAREDGPYWTRRQEVEARAVEDRQSLTSEERRDRAPWMGEDIGKQTLWGPRRK